MGSNKNKKIMSKLLLTSVVLSLVSVDAVPLFSYANDYKGEEGVTIVEEENSPETDDESVVEETKEELEEEVISEESIDSVNVEGEEVTELTESMEDETIQKELEDEKEVEVFKMEETVPTPQMESRMMAVQTVNNYELATDADFSGTSNGSFRYIGTKEYVEIPHKIKGVAITNISNMFNGAKVKGVKSTNKNIRYMNNLFMDFNGSSVDISQLDTSSVISFYGMFWGTTHAQNKIRTIIGLENLDTSQVQDMNRMFYRSSVLDFNLQNFNTENVRTMGGMFEDSLAPELDLSSFNTEKVVDMSRMFYISRVQDLDVSMFDTVNVRDMSVMFQDVFSSDIKGVETLDTSKVTNMENMFKNTRLTTNPTLNFNTTNVTNMGGMFSNSSITNLDLKNFDTTKVTTMDNMFENAKAVSLNVSSFNTGNVQSMNSMFMGARAKELDLRSFNTSKVTDMIYMFRDSEATKLDVSSFDTGNVTKMTQMFSNTRAEGLNLKGFKTQNVSDMREMFRDSQSKELDLSTFNTSRITDMSNMFSGTSATVIDLSSFDTTYVTNMNSMFKDSKIEKIDLSSFDMSSVNDTGSMVAGVSAVEGVARTSMDADKINKSSNKPAGLNFNTLYVLAKDEDFSGFYNGIFKYIGDDEYVEIPNKIKGTNITSYKDMFANTRVKGVVSTNTHVTDMSGMFKGNTSEELDISNLNTGNVTGMSSMFQDTKTTRLDLTGFVTDNVVDMSSMFRNTMVNEMDLGSFNLNKVTTTENMFQNTVATIGYARAQEDLNKLNQTTNKPSGLMFTIWGIITQQNTDEWTNQPVEVGINAVSDKVGINYVEMVNETGRNYLLNSKSFNSISSNNNASHPVSRGYDSEVGANWVYGRYAPTNIYTLSTYIQPTYTSGRGTQFSEDLYPVPDDLVFSVAVMSYKPMKVGMRGGSTVTLRPGEWTRITSSGSGYTGRPDGIDAPSQSNIPLGTKLYYKEYKVEKGEVATPWKPAPEDSETSSGKKDAFKVYSNGTYIFRATDTEGNTKTVSHTVTNMDTEQPTAELRSSPEGWTSQDVTIYVNAEDDLSGVDFITLPNGTKVSGTTVEYPVDSNGTYTFKVTDKAGNGTTYTETITNIDKSVPKLTSKVGNVQWTSGTVDIEVESEESASGLKGIEMVNSPLEGRNLLVNTGELKQVTFSGWQYYFPDVKLSALGVDTLRKGGNYRFQGFVDNLKGEDVVGLMLHLPTSDVNYLQYTLSNTEQIPINPNSKGNVYMELDLDANKDIQTGYVALRHSSINAKSTTSNMEKVKLEFGESNTPWTVAPEDVKLDGNKKVYPVATNGIYTFKATYNNGTTSDSSVNVSNIDRTKPEVTVKGNIEDWTEEESITLTLNAKDTQSGVKSITLPDGTTTTNTVIDYKVTKNGDYKFIVTDNVGNTTTHTETVEYLMIPYSFYIYDAKGNPVHNAKFELLRNGEGYKTAISDSTGLVDFGRIPPTGSYQIRQVTAPGGVVIDPEDVETPDVTDPIEVISYPRGTTLPSTGTHDLVLYGGLLALVSYLTTYIRRRVINTTK